MFTKLIQLKNKILVHENKIKKCLVYGKVKYSLLHQLHMCSATDLKLPGIAAILQTNFA